MVVAAAVFASIAATPAKSQAMEDGLPSARPCDELERSLETASERGPATPSVSVSEAEVRRELALVTPACREQVRRGDAPALLARVRAWSNAPNPGWQERGRILTCAFTEGSPPAELGAWMAGPEHPLARAVCLTRLPGWPGSEAALAVALERSVRTGTHGSEVDPVLLAAVKGSDTPALRDSLAPVLRTADAQHARGLDDLRDAACPKEAAAAALQSPDLRSACAATQPASENRWSPATRDERRGAVAAITATAIVAGALVGAWVWRDETAGRVIATGSGALGGLTIGIGLTGLALASGGNFSMKSGERSGALIVGAALAGGILGGVATYALASSPESRAPLTAAGLILPYLVTLAFAFK